MSKEFDTSWFDLKNYEAFKTMPIEDWIWQLVARDHYCREVSLCVAHKKKHLTASEPIIDSLLTFILSELKLGAIPVPENYPIDWHDRRAQGILIGYRFDTASVESINSMALWDMAKDEKLNHVWKACQHANDYNFEDGYNEDLGKIAYMPHDFHIKEKSIWDIEPYAHIEINLSATDEQIKNDFSHWLTHYRKAINYQPDKKLLTQADFDYWVKYGVIPYLDLMLVAKIEGKKITQNKLAKLIFPDEYDVDTTGRLRDTTKPEAERLIKDEIHRTLSTQLAYEKSTMKKVG